MRWARFKIGEEEAFGAVDGDTITVHEGSMLGTNRATTRKARLADVTLLPPVAPSKVVALWNNYRALAAKLNSPIPPEPLFLMKSTTSLIGDGQPIRKPAFYDGKVVFEGELVIVIGRTCRGLSEQEAASAIFGYTCINDVTAMEIINRDPTFAQWDRAKGFDTFGPVGPVVATGLDPMKLTVRTLVDGQERQNYPVADIVFPPAKLVSEISKCVTLLPGDLIACGTSVGVGSIKPGNVIEVSIDGIGTLKNTYQG